MHPKKFMAVSEMLAPERYNYFIRKVCDYEVVWGLRREGWATGTVDSVVTIPVWPEQEFADSYAVGEWNGFLPQKILLHDFMKKWIPGAENEKMKFAVFPTLNQKAVVVDSKMLLADLTAESKFHE